MQLITSHSDVDDRTPQHTMKIKTTQQQYNIQHAHAHADYFGISVYVFNASLFESNNFFSLQSMPTYGLHSLLIPS